MREYTTAATKLAGLGVADVPLLLPAVGLERELPRPRVRHDDLGAVDLGDLVPGDVLTRRRPRDRGIRALERNPLPAVRPAHQVLRNAHEVRSLALVPRAGDSRAVDLVREQALGRGAHRARRR